MTTRKNNELTPRFLRKVAKNLEIESIKNPDQDFFMCNRVVAESKNVDIYSNFQDKLLEHNVPMDGSLGYRFSKKHPVYLNRNYKRNSTTIRIMLLELLALQMEDFDKEDETKG